MFLIKSLIVLFTHFFQFLMKTCFCFMKSIVFFKKTKLIMIIKRKFQLKNHELITFTHLYEKNIRIINF
jgi:hypothetical protein